MKNTARLTPTLAAVLGAIAVSTAPIANADATDDSYLQGLKDAQITWAGGSDQAMIELAHSVCKDFSNGFTFEKTLADVKTATSQLADTSIAKIMGVGTGAYCPQYKSIFD
jgi:hypothetical protein